MRDLGVVDQEGGHGKARHEGVVASSVAARVRRLSRRTSSGTSIELWMFGRLVLVLLPDLSFPPAIVLVLSLLSDNEVDVV